MSPTFKRHAIAMLFALPAAAMAQQAPDPAAMREAAKEMRAAAGEMRQAADQMERAAERQRQQETRAQGAAQQGSEAQLAQPQGAQAQQAQQGTQPQAQGRERALQQAQVVQGWDNASAYRGGWSAAQMIGADVRGENGREIGEVKDIFVTPEGQISRVVVEVGGFLEVGDQHIGVPFKDVRIGQNMQYVQVPLREVENGTYSLYGRVPQGENVAAQRDNWRINELIGDYASLRDAPRYGMVSDVIFDQQGQLQRVIVNRTAGAWGSAGWYGYPFYGYRPGALDYGVPYRTAEVGDMGRWDYAELDRRSQWAGPFDDRVAGDGRAADTGAARSDTGATRSSN